jgi:hypothetical protein
MSTLSSTDLLVLLAGTGALIATISNTRTLAVHQQKQQTKVHFTAPTACQSSHRFQTPSNSLWWGAHMCTPVPFLHLSKARAYNNFVSTSAIIYVVGQYMNFTSPLQALSLTNLCCTSMCLAREWWTGFRMSASAQVESEKRCPRCLHACRNPAQDCATTEPPYMHALLQPQSLLACMRCCNEFSFSS